MQMQNCSAIFRAKKVASNKQHLCSNSCHAKQQFDVRIIKPNTAVRRHPANFARVVGAVDPVVLPRQVKRVGAKRIFWPRTLVSTKIAPSAILSKWPCHVCVRKLDRLRSTRFASGSKKPSLLINGSPDGLVPPSGGIRVMTPCATAGPATNPAAMPDRIWRRDILFSMLPARLLVIFYHFAYTKREKGTQFTVWYATEQV